MGTQVDEPGYFTTETIQEIIGCIEYKSWSFVIGEMGDGFYLQAKLTDNGDEWVTRKWYISSHSCKSEIVQTALKCVLTAEEHEVREKFLYRGHPIFGPHKDVDSLFHVTHETRTK